jgi:hypothetical protein
MRDKFTQRFTPYEKAYLRHILKGYWKKWLTGLLLLHVFPLLLAVIFNPDLFEVNNIGEAIIELLEITLMITVILSPAYIPIWCYLIYLLVRKIIPLRIDLKKGQKTMWLFPAEKYKMEEFNQFFLRTSIKDYLFLKINEWVYHGIADGEILVLEVAPLTNIYLGLKSDLSDKAILTEKPESIY